MNITLIGNKIVQDTKFLGFEKNNGVDVINVTVDTDESWTYKLDVKYPDKCCSCEQLYNIIDLTRNGNVCTVVLTKDMLPFAGKYIMQLRAINSDKVQHSDTFDAWVKYSIEPGSTYNPVPSEFYQIEQNITEINNHPPYPDVSGFWMIWNSQTNKYELSDIPVPTVTASDIGAIPVPTTAEVGQTIVVKAVDGNGKPTEWEPVTLPKQVQSDWNQNDSSAVDYVKNRPFYLKDARETRIFERVFTVQTGLSYKNLDGTNLGLEAGKEYTVNIMSQEFKATAYVYGDGVVCIGDGDAAYNGTTNFSGDVPFGVADVAGVGYVIVLSAPYLAESGLVSGPTDEIPVNIISEIQEVVPIDSKFLPKATQVSAGVISKNQVRNEIFVNELLNVSENETTYKQLREYLGHRVFSVVHCVASNISGDGVSLFVTSYQISIEDKGMVEVTGASIYGGNINGILFVFPLNSDGSGIDDDALPESISLIIPNYILLENNDKKFKITVDDSGTISATEVVS